MLDNLQLLIVYAPVMNVQMLLDGIFIGASQTKEIRNAMIISVVGYVGVSILLTRYFGNHGIWFSLLLFMIFRM